MLSSVLKSEKAIRMNIAIIRAFVKLRHAVLSSQDIARRVEKLEGKIQVHDTDIRLLYHDVQQFKKDKKLSHPLKSKGLKSVEEFLIREIRRTSAGLAYCVVEVESPRRPPLPKTTGRGFLSRTSLLLPAAFFAFANHGVQVLDGANLPWAHLHSRMFRE